MTERISGYTPSQAMVETLMETIGGLEPRYDLDEMTRDAIYEVIPNLIAFLQDPKNTEEAREFVEQFMEPVYAVGHGSGLVSLSRESDYKIVTSGDIVENLYRFKDTTND